MKRRLKRLILICLSITLLLSGGLYIFYPKSRVYPERLWFDSFNENPAINSQAEVADILASFPELSQAELPAAYKRAGGFGESKYRNITKGLRYFVIQKKDCYRRIAGNIRIMDLMSRDSMFHKTSYASDQAIYWGIDKRILNKILELRALLKAKGYDPNAFSAVNGHRYPRYNERIGGASKSRHIRGEAVDMYIGDINRDGRYTKADKAIVIDLCENHIIKNKGGVGRYPGTRTVHMDVRGYKARWDQQ
ncbi:MAG: DUF882 domain-containing protein [Bacteroidia bacterium]